MSITTRKDMIAAAGLTEARPEIAEVYLAMTAPIRHAARVAATIAAAERLAEPIGVSPADIIALDMARAHGAEHRSARPLLGELGSGRWEATDGFAFRGAASAALAQLGAHRISAKALGAMAIHAPLRAMQYVRDHAADYTPAEIVGIAESVCSGLEAQIADAVLAAFDQRVMWTGPTSMGYEAIDIPCRYRVESRRTPVDDSTQWLVIVRCAGIEFSHWVDGPAAPEKGIQ